jgi:RNase adaptor protein for sRNA GlmZ degradation
MPKFAELCYQTDGKIERIAVVVDIRGGGFFDDCLSVWKLCGIPAIPMKFFIWKLQMKLL